jgi:ABC-2 type transport system permease protein
MNGQLTDALRMEWVRLWTVRSTYVLSATAVLIGAAASALIAGLGKGSDPDPALTTMVLTSGADVVPLPFAATFMAVLGVLSVGHDYRYGLSRSLLTAMPGRSSLVAARLILLALVSVLVAAAGIVLNGGLGVVFGGRTMAFDGDVVRSCFGYLLLTVLWAWLGAAGTWLLRATVPVLTILLVMPLVVEPLLRTLSLAQGLHWLRPVATWLPFTAGRAMTAAVAAGGVNDLNRLDGGLVFGALVLAALAPAWLLFRRRDA